MAEIFPSITVVTSNQKGPRSHLLWNSGTDGAGHMVLS